MSGINLVNEYVESDAVLLCVLHSIDERHSQLSDIDKRYFQGTSDLVLEPMDFSQACINFSLAESRFFVFLLASKLNTMNEFFHVFKLLEMEVADRHRLLERVLDLSPFGILVLTIGVSAPTF